jgi:SAM-dependent methyltransferase
VKVRDDPLHPDPAFADLYAALPEPKDLWPWLDWCRAAELVLYLGIGAGRLAAPLLRAGIEIVGVDAHPGMLAHLRRRLPGIEAYQALIETLDLARRFDLVIGPSSILMTDANLAAAARHLRPGGRVGMELMNPHWLLSGPHEGVRLVASTIAPVVMEVDYRLPDGTVVTQVVEDGHHPGPWPEGAEERLERLGLQMEWMGGTRGADLADSPTYYVLASRPRG